MALTDEQIAAGKFGANVRTSMHQKVVQANQLIPIVVNLVTEKTLGRAILDTIAATPELLARFNDKDEAEILACITAVAFVLPAVSIQVRAYQGATVQMRVVPAADTTYLPCVGITRNYCFGDAGSDAITLDVYAEI